MCLSSPGSWPPWRPRPAPWAASPAARTPCTSSPRRKASSRPSAGSSARRRRDDWPTWLTDRSWWTHMVCVLVCVCENKTVQSVVLKDFLPTWSSCVLFSFRLFLPPSRHRSDHDGRGHGGAGHGREQAGHSGWEGPQVEEEVSLIQSGARPRRRTHTEEGKEVQGWKLHRGSFSGNCFCCGIDFLSESKSSKCTLRFWYRCSFLRFVYQASQFKGPTLCLFSHWAECHDLKNLCLQPPSC